jgi:crotonobetainyl-CoA hydratase
VSVHARVDGGVGTVVIDNPPLNVMTSGVRAQLLDAVADFRARGVRALVVTGAGTRAFCAGADLNEERALTPATVQAFLDADEALFSALSDYPGGVVAAVNGHAYGGGFELALACDILVAAEDATFGLPEPRVGLMAAAGGVHRLPRHLPYHLAMGMLLTGRRMTAAEALQHGLVNEVVPRAELLAAARRWAESILECSPLSIRATKEAANRGLDMRLEDALGAVLPGQTAMIASEDFVEGPKAFAQKRKPEWKGR